jgi:hypothetical protein
MLHPEGRCPVWGSGGREAFTEELLAAMEAALLPRRADTELREDIMRTRMAVLRGLFARYPDHVHLDKALVNYVFALKRESERRSS